MLFWHTAADGEADDAELDIDMDVVAPWVDVPLVEDVAPPAEPDDVVVVVDDPEDETRIAPTWVLSEARKVVPLPLLTKHWPGPTPLALPAKVKAVHCTLSIDSDMSQYIKQSLAPFVTP